MGRLLTVACVAGILAAVAMRVDAAEKTAPERVLRHVVLFKWKGGTPSEKVKEIEDAFRALPKKVDAIKDFEWGTDVSIENLAQGFTHCFLVTFASEEARAAYLPHPDHKAFVDLIKPHLDKVLVVDYWAGK